jgi:hypothetical protein
MPSPIFVTCSGMTTEARREHFSKAQSPISVRDADGGHLGTATESVSVDARYRKGPSFKFMFRGDDHCTFDAFGAGDDETVTIVVKFESKFHMQMCLSVGVFLVFYWLRFGLFD